MSCLVIYSRAFLKTELTETVTNALIIYRLLVGGSPSQYADISMNVKKENDTDETHKFLGNLNLTIYPKDVNLNLIPVRSDIPTEPAPRAKRAYIYMLCVQKVMKLVLFISGTVKNPEEEVHNTSLYKSLQRLYERLSTDLDLSGELKDVCEQFVDSERFWINYHLLQHPGHPRRQERCGVRQLQLRGRHAVPAVHQGAADEDQVHVRGRLTSAERVWYRHLALCR